MCSDDTEGVVGLVMVCGAPPLDRRREVRLLTLFQGFRQEPNAVI